MGAPYTPSPVPELACTGSAAALPVRVRPERDELFSSWLARAALANGLRVNQLCRVLVGRERSLFSGDPDRGVQHDPADRLANLMNLPVDLARQTYLRAYEGFLWQSRPERGMWRNVLPVGDKDHRRLYFGLQYCPECLSEDAAPYYRRSWRLAFSVVCDWHRCDLLESCPHCGAPIRPHRIGTGLKRYEGCVSLTSCTQCRGDLLDVKRTTPPLWLVDFQRLLLASLDRGWISISGRCIHGVSFFEGLHILMSLLDADKRGTGLDARGLEVGKCSVRIARYGGLERCSLQRRRAVLERTAMLLKNWPEDAMRDLDRAGVTSSHLMKFSRDKISRAPFWLWQPVHECLDRSAYVPSEKEVECAAKYLLRISKNPTGRQLHELLNMNTRSSARISRLWRVAKRSVDCSEGWGKCRTGAVEIEEDNREQEYGKRLKN